MALAGELERARAQAPDPAREQALQASYAAELARLKASFEEARVAAEAEGQRLKEQLHADRQRHATQVHQLQQSLSDQEAIREQLAAELKKRDEHLSELRTQQEQQEKKGRWPWSR